MAAEAAVVVAARAHKHLSHLRVIYFTAPIFYSVGFAAHWFIQSLPFQRALKQPS